MDTYWSRSGKFQTLAEQLRGLIPDSGACVNPRTLNKFLEKFRRMNNCYYDLYNNGLCNRRPEFARRFTLMSLIPAKGARRSDIFMFEVDLNMDIAILKAAREQRFITNEEFEHAMTHKVLLDSREEYQNMMPHQKAGMHMIFNYCVHDKLFSTEVAL